MTKWIEIEALLLAIPCCLQTGDFSPRQRRYGWSLFSRLLRIYLEEKNDG